MPPSGPLMATPSPYGSVSDEARRRYEERYAKKREETARKEEEEERKKLQGQQPQQPPPQQQQGPPRPPQQGYPPYGGPPPPGRPSSINQSPQLGQLPPGQNPPRSQFSPQQTHFSPNPVNGNPYPPGQYPTQRPPGPPAQQGPPGGYQQGYTSPQQRYSGPPGGYNPNQGQPGPAPPRSAGVPPPQWSQQAVPPPNQQWAQQQQQPQQVVSPPPADQPPKQELEILFEQFDGSRTGQLNAYDLQKLLAKDATMEAREDCVKMLMNIFDTDRSGSINFQEFEGLYRYIKDWHAIFLRFDRDNSGLIDRKELHSALLGFGFSLPSEMVRKLEKRYAPPPNPGQPPMKGISFDRFLMACVTVKHYTEAFRRMDVRGEGRVTFDYNEFMEIVLDAPS
ncbi:hypothetical protein M231_03760 [Tremella mesenterica]|uniref:EF-hand domain-containing protein n=2 Tax=Tremella mesenterica TaxID=5217 RepID=A0A4Q1BM75_TREME|nr:hypothetical protein M231_03760 [Tremella mesenterica]